MIRVMRVSVSPWIVVGGVLDGVRVPMHWWNRETDELRVWMGLGFYPESCPILSRDGLASMKTIRREDD